MNTQTALKRCFNYFMDMNHESGYRNGSCVYYANGSDPVRCAIGCLIPQRYEKEAGEKTGAVDALFDEMPVLREYFRHVDQGTLIDMQECHDQWAITESGNYIGAQTTRETFLDHLQSLMCFHENDD